MRILIAVAIALAGLAPGVLRADPARPAGDARHVAVEATTLVLDRERVQRLGLGGVVLSSEDASVGASRRSPANVRVGSRVGGLDVSAWLDVVRRKRAVRRESTQRIVVLSGSAAQLSSGSTVVGPYGYEASAGPRLWVEPVALEDGRVRLRVWTAVGEVRSGPYGTMAEEVPVEAGTEVVVPSGTPVLVASTENSESRSHRGLLERGSADAAREAWVVVTPRVVDDPAQAFALPAGFPDAWLEH